MNIKFDKIFVIHLKRNKKRLINLKNEIGNKFNYQLFDGIEPDNFPKQEFDWNFYINKYPDLHFIKSKSQAFLHFQQFGQQELRTINSKTEIVNKGQLGCLLSHLQIIKIAKKNKYKSILILEDDIRLHKDFIKEINNIEFLPKWKLLYLGVSQDNWENINLENNYYYANESRGTFAYAIQYEFYDILINHFERKNKPVDKYLIDIQKLYKKEILVYYPNLIIADLSTSNISGYRNHIDWFKKFRWNKINYYKKNKIIILILSCKNNTNRQKIIRETYIKDIKKLGYEYYFLIGSNKTKREDDILYKMEDDILYVNIEDLYENLPLKILQGYKYLYKNIEFDYIYKIDDDIMININRLEEIPYYNYEYYGRLVGKESFNRTYHQSKVSNNSFWKNKIYDKSYLGKWYGGGFTYFLSKNALDVIIKNPKLIENDLLEDKAIGDTLKIFGDEEFDIVEECDDMSKFICNHYKINFEKNKIIFFEVEEKDMSKIYSLIHN